jgi:hypothetical protein
MVKRRRQLLYCKVWDLGASERHAFSIVYLFERA